MESTKLDKDKLYNEAIDAIKDRNKELTGNDMVSKMATVASVLKAKIPYYFWCGFYFAENNEMIVGPYQGPTACPNIGYEGVCGASAKKKESVLVSDVHKFPGHIVCDASSQSEIVVPIIDEKGNLIGVFDVDSSELDAFDDVDKAHLEKIMALLL